MALKWPRDAEDKSQKEPYSDARRWPEGSTGGAIAERIIAEAEGKPDRKLGRELLEEFALMFGGLASAFQPVGTGPGGTVTSADLEAWTKSYKEPLFEKYAKLAAKCADAFADFQGPRLARVQVAAPRPDPHGPVKKKFTLSIFDSQGRQAPRHIDVSQNKRKEPTRSSD